MKYTICKGVLWQETDGEIVIVAPKQDPAYLNESGSSVWKLIDKGLDETNIVDSLSKEYGTAEKIIKKDVLNIIKELLKNNYIKEVK
ncbi:MAG: PqqD family protein [Endomicrobiaceae bacterium]|nr:PqqD family protein [Endomicrobiaceae bacterium]